MYKLLTIILFLSSFIKLNAQEVKILSPDRQMEVRVNTSPDMTWSIYYKNELILKKSKIALQLNDGYLLGVNQKLLSKKITSIQNTTKVAIPTKIAYHKTSYKGMIFTFKINNLREYKVEFRVFNDGAAYRFITNFENELKIENELVELNFPKNTESYFPKETKFISRYEPHYQHVNMDSIGYTSFASLPILMNVKGVNMLFSEMNLVDYPNMYLLANQEGRLTAFFPYRVKEMRPDPKKPDRNEIRVLDENDIALTYGKRDFPWRYFIISENEGDLIESSIPYTLATPRKIWEVDWIKPGHVVCDLYNANGLYKEKYMKDIDTYTYKDYIDFAAKYGFEYVMMGEGWSKTTKDITLVRDGLNMEEIVDYGQKKNVGIILWMLWKPLDEHMDSVLNTYQKWGIKGIKVDFMQRGDQYMVNYYERVAKAAADHRLVVDFHASFKPVGLSRAYPNVLSYEGVRGNKYNKCSDDITPEHTLIIPFIRMAVGPMDFAPGSMRNVHKNQFQVSESNPMSMGTRCRQLAMYITYESGLQMLCDAPFVYESDPEIPQLISRIPVSWDETRVLEGKIGEVIVIARRKGKSWYVGAMTNAQERDIKIDLRKFLSPGNYNLTLVEDEPSTKSNAEDYSISTKTIASNQSINVFMVAGGGCLAIFEPMKSSKKKKKR